MEESSNYLQMNPLTLLLPLAIILGGVLFFVFLPFEPTLRALVLAMDLVAAVVVGIVFWKRQTR